MPGCEKCWDDAFRRSHFCGGNQVVVYHKLLKSRKCTPEEQAGGTDAGYCPKCQKFTMHRVCNVCMGCNYGEKGKP